MCRGLRILVVAPTAEGVIALRRATVAAQWEVVGAAEGLDRLEEELESSRPDVVVLDAAVGPEAVAAVRRLRPRARLLSVGALEGTDQVADSIAEIRAAILGLPGPGGPVRTSPPT